MIKVEMHEKENIQAYIKVMTCLQPTSRGLDRIGGNVLHRVKKGRERD